MLVSTKQFPAIQYSVLHSTETHVDFKCITGSRSEDFAILIEQLEWLMDFSYDIYIYICIITILGRHFISSFQASIALERVSIVQPLAYWVPISWSGLVLNIDMILWEKAPVMIIRVIVSPITI